MPLRPSAGRPGVRNGPGATQAFSAARFDLRRVFKEIRRSDLERQAPAEGVPVTLTG
jgi:hypothetical protein